MYRADEGGKTLTLVGVVRENTWHDDGDDSKEFPFDNDATYLVGRYYTDGHTPIWNWGFYGVEPKGPAPAKGWRWDQVGHNAVTPVRVEHMRDYLLALAGNKFVSDAELMGRGTVRTSPSFQRLVEISYERGDQPAAAYAVYGSDGEFRDFHWGSGDATPIPIVGPHGNWQFTTEKAMEEEDDARERSEWEARQWASVDAGEEFECGSVVRHLRDSYRVGSNPLPRLRRKYGGVWRWFESGPQAAPGDVQFVQNNPPHGTFGFGWCVTWAPGNR